jgi:hypothetical protein
MAGGLPFVAPQKWASIPIRSALPACSPPPSFHRPEELEAEVIAAGFVNVKLVAVEGPALLLAGLEQRAADAKRWSGLLEALRLLEGEPSMFGVTGHLLAIGTRPDDGDVTRTTLPRA